MTKMTTAEYRGYIGRVEVAMRNGASGVMAGRPLAEGSVSRSSRR